MRVLVCLPHDGPDNKLVLDTAAALAQELRAPLCVLYVYPSRWRGSPLPGGWYIKSDDPLPAILRFAAKQRCTHIVSGLWP